MAVKIIDDASKFRSLVLLAIKKYGSGVEHNYQHFLNLEEKPKKCIFVSFGSGMGILVHKDNKNVWYTLDTILAPENKKLSLFSEFADYVLQECKGKIITETTPQFRKQLVTILKKKYYFPKIQFSLYWPVFDLKKWDPAMKGGRWKKIRNLKNRLHRFHKVQAMDAKKVPAGELLSLVDSWVKNKYYQEDIGFERYKNLIASGFKGCDYARCILVDGKVATLCAGWKIPNSKGVYSAVGLLNYSNDGSSEVAYADELNYLKSIGIHEADFGGSDKPMLNFKKKFKPYKIYRTITYSIMRKKRKR